MVVVELCPSNANFNAQVLCLKVVFKVRQRVAPATLALALTEASALARVRHRLPASVVMELSRLLDTMATVEWPWTGSVDAVANTSPDRELVRRR